MYPKQPVKNLREAAGQTLHFTSAHRIKSQFGDNYICRSADGRSFFSNSAVKKYLEARKDLKQPFTCKVLPEKQFEVDGELRTFTPVECY